MITLNETAKLMMSMSYKDRFVAEYAQTCIRYKKLLRMLQDWDHGMLSFKPTCPRELYEQQLQHMDGYLSILRARAALEHVDLPEISD